MLQQHVAVTPSYYFNSLIICVDYFFPVKTYLSFIPSDHDIFSIHFHLITRLFCILPPTLLPNIFNTSASSHKRIAGDHKAYLVRDICPLAPLPSLMCNSIGDVSSCWSSFHFKFAQYTRDTLSPFKHRFPYSFT